MSAGAGMGPPPPARGWRGATKLLRRGPLSALVDHLLFRRGTERSQAVARLVLTSGAVAYLCAMAARSPAPAVTAGLQTAAAFLGFAVLLYFTTRLWPRPSRLRRVVAILADQGTISYAMHATGGIGAVFYPLYLWVSVGNGMRFGPGYLALATAAGLAGFGAVVAAGPYWHANAPLAAGLLLGILVLPAFYWTLLRDLHRANRRLAGRLRGREASAGADPLTGLADRHRFLEALGERVAWALAGRRRLGLAVADLDGLARVNDGLGHEAGDALLRQAAHRLRRLARPGDTVARIGADEFVLLRPDPPAGSALAREVLDALEPPYRLAGNAVSVGANVGVALLPDHAASGGELLRAAQQALHRARHEGGGRHRVHGPGMARCSSEALLTETALHRALARGELVLHFQPRVALASGAIVAAEALLRWERPGHGLLRPAAFLALAERSELICRMGEWVLGEVVAMRRRLESAGHGEVALAANLAPVELGRAELCARLARALGGEGTEHPWLELEITERAALDPGPELREILLQLRRRKVRIALDDFGTGYSSLAHLRELPVDILKIDSRFVAGVDREPRDRALVEAVLRLAHALGIRVVAEGVERPSQARILAELGCDEAQGYLYHPPLPPDGFLALLYRHAREHKGRTTRH